MIEYFSTGKTDGVVAVVIGGRARYIGGGFPRRTTGLGENETW